MRLSSNVKGLGAILRLSSSVYNTRVKGQDLRDQKMRRIFTEESFESFVEGVLGVGRRSRVGAEGEGKARKPEA